jgi:hypothetical protein
VERHASSDQVRHHHQDRELDQDCEAANGDQGVSLRTSASFENSVLVSSLCDVTEATTPKHSATHA